MSAICDFSPDLLRQLRDHLAVDLALVQDDGEDVGHRAGKAKFLLDQLDQVCRQGSRLEFTAFVQPLGVNHSYAPARFGKRHGFRKTDKAKIYQQSIQTAAIRAIGHKRTVEWPLQVEIRFYWPTQAGDVDGPIKLVLDALQGIVYVNDKQVKRLVIERHKDSEHPRIEVVVDRILDGRFEP